MQLQSVTKANEKNTTLPPECETGGWSRSLVWQEGALTGSSVGIGRGGRASPFIHSTRAGNARVRPLPPKAQSPVQGTGMHLTTAGCPLKDGGGGTLRANLGHPVQMMGQGKHLWE